VQFLLDKGDVASDTGDRSERRIDSWGTRAMATRFPTKLVITRVSPFVAFGAIARVFLATGLASINERPMQLTKWIVACLLLCFPGIALAGTEARCTALGVNCICGEQMNGSPNITGMQGDGGAFIDFADSPASTDCYPRLASSGGENFCYSGNFSAVTSSSQSAFLPPGHALSFLFRQAGAGVCHIGSNPNIVEAADMTYCMRSYRRNDAASHVPQNSLEQQKILTIGGVEPPNGFITIQLSMDVGGDVHTRFDGDYWNAPIDFQGLGNMSQCIGNFCRFEACMDVSATGEGRARFRMTRLSPGSGQVTVVNKPVGTVLRPSGVNVQGVAGGGDAMYGQNGNYITYNSHFIITKVRPENRSFWPGPACEVEGGCSGGGPTPPAAPTGLITQ